jgi:hypothetical protein
LFCGKQKFTTAMVCSSTLGVTNPDSGLAEKSYLRHPGLNDYRRMIPSLSVKEKP